MSYKKYLFSTLIAVSCLIFMTPGHMRLYSYTNNRIKEETITSSLKPITPEICADLNADGFKDCLVQKRKGIQLQSISDDPELKTVLWESPTSWHIPAAAITDLNHDQQLEITLLVWRPYRMLPIDQYLPVKQTSTNFINSDGQSCQFILIGLKNGEFQELWAGSALAQPVQSFSVVDLNQDGVQELITLDGRYENNRMPAQTLSIWNWNGFGFNLSAQVIGQFRLQKIVQTEDQRTIATFR